MVRKAKIGDVKVIHRITNISSGKDEMLPGSLTDIYGNLRDFFVYVENGGMSIKGICAMHIFWDNLAEIRSLYVDEGCRKAACGSLLFRSCVP
jgi:amino-acid N-acetyltransferase